MTLEQILQTIITNFGLPGLVLFFGFQIASKIADENKKKADAQAVQAGTIASLTERLDTELTVKQDRITILEGQVRNLVDREAATDNKLHRLDEQNNELKQAMARERNQAQEIREADKKIIRDLTDNQEKMKTELAELRKSFDDKTAELHRMTTERDQAQQTIKDLEVERATLTQRITYLEEELKRVTADYETRIHELETKIIQLTPPPTEAAA